MIASTKNCRATILASLLALGVGSVHAQHSMESSSASQTGPSAATAATHNGAASPAQTSKNSSESGPSGTAETNGGASTSGANPAAKQEATGKQEPNTGVIYMMVPMGVVTADDAMKRGCWVKLYDAQSYGGESLTLVGPTAINDMSGPFGINWDDRVKSLQTGPLATLTVFDDEDFDDRVAQFKPRQQVADISKRLGFFDEFGSVRLECTTS